MPRAIPQPQYDLINSGDDSARPPSRSQFRDSFRASSIQVRADDSNETLRKQLHRVEYELNNLRAERDMANLRHQEELRNAQRKADAEYERAQTSESSANMATNRFDALAKELEEAKEAASESRTLLEQQLRDAQERADGLQEQVDDKNTEVEDQNRQFTRDMGELKATLEPLQKELETTRSQRDEQTSAIHTTQQRLKESEDDVGLLQQEISRLKSQADTDDSNTQVVIKRELSEQVAHLHTLEAENNKQRIELKKLREERRDVELIEEQKRDLKSRLSRMGDLRQELAEAQLQRRILEDERKAWTNLLESESNDSTDVTFERPEDLARAYLQERIERLSLVDELGKVRPDLQTKDEQIQTLELDLRTVRTEVEKLRSNTAATGGTSSANAGLDAKAKARLERQRALAIKEVDYLRAQLKAIDDEQSEFTSDKFDESKSQRIKELEDLVDQYRNETQALQADIEKAQSSNLSTNAPTTGSKRAREDDDEEIARSGSLARKARSLQEELNKVTTARKMLEMELSAARSQIESMKETSSTRILELRANPTAEAAQIKQSTLDNLRAENESLLAQLDGPKENEPPRTRSDKSSARNKTVPATSLERLRAELEEKQQQISSLEKKEKRLKSTFSAQVRQFREATASVLGWDLNILPNDRAKVTSMFDPTKQNRDKDASGDEEEEQEERSIIFDAKQGTMKVSGGPKSKFADEIRGLIEFWVDGRKEVPCFLAACTLEFWEKGPGAQTLR